MGSNGLILWLMAGAGVILTYSAITNVTPQSLILHTIGQGDLKTITGETISATTGGTTGNGVAGGGGGGGSGSGVVFKSPGAYTVNGHPSATLIQSA